MSDSVSSVHLNSLHRDHTGIQWLKGLANSGLRRSMSPEAESAYELAARIHDLDEAIQETYAMDQLYFLLPKGWWIWVPGLYGFGFLWALQKDHIEDRLTAWGMLMMLFGIFATWVLVAKAYRERKARTEKRRRRPILKEKRRALMEDLLAIRDGVVDGSFGP